VRSEGKVCLSVRSGEQVSTWTTVPLSLPRSLPRKSAGNRLPMTCRVKTSSSSFQAKQVRVARFVESRLTEKGKRVEMMDMEPQRCGLL
jgi:hypothetical protein